MSVVPPAGPLGRIGIVIHPMRSISGPLHELQQWAEAHAVEVVQVAVLGQTRRVAPEGEAGECALIVSIGGDGTMLAAIHAGLAAGRPVLGVACGSLGVMTRISPGQLARALDRFAAGDWLPRDLPALEITRPGEPGLVAFNDLVVIRAGIGQIRVAVYVDDVLYTRIAGDGVIACTALGSSAYSLAAGGPLLGLGTDGYVVTPLPTHGGSAPPLVVAPEARMHLDVGRGYGGARLEADGQIVTGQLEHIDIKLRPGAARIVGFDDQEPLLSVLRRRGILIDSPRIRAEEAREGHDPQDRDH